MYDIAHSLSYYVFSVAYNKIILGTDADGILLSGNCATCVLLYLLET
jgi:hypothetical protein